MKHIVNNYGLPGVYQGLPATVARNTVAVSMYFGFYELTKKHLADESEKKTEKYATWKLMTAGGIGGLMYWPLIYPVDVVKSAIQADNIVKDRQYSNTLDAFKKLYKQGGVKRFFPGFAPCMMRAVPANAVCFTGYELASNFLKENL